MRPKPELMGGTALNALSDQARQLFRHRRRRDESLGGELFGEPAWDLLLDLFIARCQRRPVSIISASVAASIPVKSALPWLLRLEEHGLVERIYEAQDEALTLVAISDAGFDRMTGLLCESRGAAPSGPRWFS